MMTNKAYLLALLLQLALASIGLCDQKTLDMERDSHINAVIKSIQRNSPADLTSCLSGLSEKEASKILEKIAKKWGNISKFVRADRNLPKGVHKGNMLIIVHWGAEQPTQIGRWTHLKDAANDGTYMQVGLLFAKGSSKPRQLIAAEYKAEQGVGLNRLPTVNQL